MTFVRTIDEEQATGSVAEDYAFLVKSYGALFGRPSAPEVYRASSLVPAYLRFGTLQNRVLTNDGTNLVEGGPIPRFLVNYAVGAYSACFY